MPSVATLDPISSAGFAGRGDSDSSPAIYQSEPLPTQIAYSATRLSYDSEIRRLFFQYRDTDTGEVEREIPSREALRAYEQQERGREETGREVNEADDAVNRRLQVRVIDGESVSQARNVTSGTETDSGSDSPSTDSSAPRGVTTDQFV